MLQRHPPRGAARDSGESGSLAKKISALCHAQTIPRALQEVLQLLAAHAEESDAFRSVVAGRLEVVESIVRSPTEEVEDARRRAVNELSSLHRSGREVASSLRATQEAVFGEVELKYAQLAAAVRRAQECVAAVDADCAAAAEARVAKFSCELDAVTHSVVATTVERLRTTQTEMGEILRDEVDHMVARHAAGLESSARSWRTEAEGAIREAASFVRDAAADGIKAVEAAASSAEQLVSRATETLSTLPLQEAHHARCVALLCEAQLDLSRDAAAAAAGGGAAASAGFPRDLQLLRERLERLEQELGLDAPGLAALAASPLQLSGSSPFVSAPLSPHRGASPHGSPWKQQQHRRRQEAEELGRLHPAASFTSLGDVLSSSPSLVSLKDGGPRAAASGSPPVATTTTTRTPPPPPSARARSHMAIRSSILGADAAQGSNGPRRASMRSSPPRVGVSLQSPKQQQQQQKQPPLAMSAAAMAQATQVETLTVAVRSAQSDVAALRGDVAALGRIINTVVLEKLHPLAALLEELLRLLGVDEGWLLHRGPAASLAERTSYIQALPWCAAAAAAAAPAAQLTPRASSRGAPPVPQPNLSTTPSRQLPYSTQSAAAVAAAGPTPTLLPPPRSTAATPLEPQPQALAAAADADGGVGSALATLPALSPSPSLRELASLSGPPATPPSAVKHKIAVATTAAAPARPDETTKLVGLEVQAPSASRRRGRTGDSTVQVARVWPASRAADAGFAVGDLVLRVDEADVADASALETALRTAAARAAGHADEAQRRRQQMVVVHVLRPSEAKLMDLVLDVA